MYFPFGRQPELHPVGGADGVTGTQTSWLVVFVSLLLTAPALAHQSMPLTLAEVEDHAVASEPGQQALLAKAAALTERGVVAGELPDPMLRLGLNNYPIQSGGFSTEAMTNAAVGLRQEFPAGDTRALSTRRFNFLAGEMNQNAAARGRNVLTAARQAWLDVYYWEQAQVLVTESRPLFDDLLTISRSLYAVGRKSQQDVLRAELELSRIDDRLIEIERQQSHARAALGEWIGDAADRPIVHKLPAWSAVPPIESMHSMLLQHPVLQAADAQIEAQETGVELAKQRSKPNWAIDVGYSYRDGSLPSGDPRSDMVSVGVTVGLPFFRKKSVDGSLSAALQDRSAAKSSREQGYRRLESQLEAEYARWQDLGRRLSLYDEQILDLAKDNAEAALLAYQSDRGDFADVMRAHIDDLNTRIAHIRLQVERAQSYAVLANLGDLPR